MTDLFDLIGYQLPTVMIEDGQDGKEVDDPKYITPPIRVKDGGDRQPQQPEPDTENSTATDGGDRQPINNELDHPPVADPTGKQPRLYDQQTPIFAMFRDYLESAFLMMQTENPDKLENHHHQMIGCCDRVFNAALNGDTEDRILTNIFRLMSNFRKEFYTAQSARLSDPVIHADKSEPEPPTTAIAPTPNPDSFVLEPTPTIKGGYIEEKTITTKNGKQNTYLYERWRENGRLKSKYLGKKKGAVTSPR